MSNVSRRADRGTSPSREPTDPDQMKGGDHMNNNTPKPVEAPVAAKLQSRGAAVALHSANHAATMHNRLAWR